MHMDAAQPLSKDEIIKTLQSYGISVYVTELDVDLSKVSGPNRDKIQGDLFSTVARACLEAGACKGITFWEAPGDQFNWLENYLHEPNANGTLYIDNLKPKLAYYEFMRALYLR